MISIDNWNTKSGKIVIKQHDREFTFNLYANGTANCFLVAVYEYTDPDTKKTMEQLQWFFADKRHGEIMLGLAKDQGGKKENHMDPVRKLTLYKKTCTDWKKIMCLFAEAYPTITIELLEAEPEPDMVTITCYGKAETLSREEAIMKYRDCIANSEGAERDRYMNVMAGLTSGEKNITDERR